MFAVVTVLGVLKLLGLLGLAFIALAAALHWMSYGGFIGFWMANDMIHLLGVILTAIGEAISSMKD